MSRIYLRMPIQNVAVVEKLVTVYYFEHKKDYKSKGEHHSFWEINYVDSGTVYVDCEGTEYRVSKGELLLLPPDRHHILRVDGQKGASVFIISFEVQSALLEQLGGGVYRLHDALTDALRTVVRTCRQTYVLPMEDLQTQCLLQREDAPPGSQQLVRISLEALLIGLIQTFLAAQASPRMPAAPSKAQFDDKIAAQIMELLTTRLYSRLTLDEIAKALGYGKTYVSGVFRKVYGTGIMSYYNQLKIDEACRRICDGEATIAEISEQLCFSTPQYFSKCFTQHMGMSPRAFRNSVKGTWSTMQKR